MIYFVTVGSRRFEVFIDGDFSNVKINGREIKVDHRSLRGGTVQSLLADGANYEFAVHRSEGGFDFWNGSEQLHVDISDEKTERLKQLTRSAKTDIRGGTLKAPMPGLVLKIEVEIGQHVEKGDGLIIIEAMKMENELKAHAPAVIKDIKVKSGQPVEKNQVLIVFE
jgi:biotin carboxyl carrier protein